MTKVTKEDTAELHPDAEALLKSEAENDRLRREVEVLQMEALPRPSTHLRPSTGERDPQTRTYVLLQGSHSRTEYDEEAQTVSVVSYEVGERIDLTLNESRSPAFKDLVDGPRLELFTKPTGEAQFDFSHLAKAEPDEAIRHIKACKDLSELEAIWEAEESREKPRITIVRELESRKEEITTT